MPVNYLYLNSPFVGPHYDWFCELGYPQCDLHIFATGEWAILEMMNAPLVPSLTQWRWIAKGFRNIEPQKSRVAKILDRINPQKQQLWDEEEERSKQAEAAINAREQRAEDVAEEWTQSIVRNPDLQERIAKNGIDEILPHKIAAHIPESKLAKL
jgi:hypothetical protein